MDLSPEGPHHPAPRAAAPHLHPEVSLAICAQLGNPVKVTGRSIPAFPHPPKQFPTPSSQPQTARLGVRALGSKFRKRQSFWGPPGCPRGPSPYELTLLCCSCSPCPVCPEQLLGQAACGLLPCLSSGTEPPFRSPQGLPEVTILAFLFLLFCKINPLGFLCLSPFVSHEAPRLCHELACCKRSPPVWGNTALAGHTDCSAGPKGPLGCHWDIGVQGG